MKILKFYADWCGPCKVLTKSFESAGIEHTPVNADENEELCTKYNVRNLPTVVAIKDSGEEVRRFTGIKSAKDLTTWMESLKGYNE